MASFPYRKEHSPLLGEILRPVASIQVKSRVGKWFPALMYVDSGADITLVPRDFGRLLGLDLAENPGTITGVTGDSLRVSLQDVEVRIAGSAFRSKIAVSARNDVPYLLGRNGVFRAFTVIFQEYRSLVRFDQVS